MLLTAASLLSLFLGVQADTESPPEFSPNSPVVRNGSALRIGENVWTASGANVYWLGLDENVIPAEGQPFFAPLNASYPTKGRITEAMSTLTILGARTIRSQTMGISVGNPLSVMPELGKVNDKAFDSMDWAVAEARKHGIRIFAPLTDNYDYYHGGKFVFLRWRGVNVTSKGDADPRVQQFYTNRTIIDDFKNYIKVIITHMNPYTNLTYAEDPTIFAYETGNELSGPKFGDKDVPIEWTKEISEYIKELAPTKLTIDGTYGINETHLDIPSVDIYSDHFYPMDIDRLSTGVEAVGKASKVYFAGEYGWTPQSQTKTNITTFFKWIEERNQPNVTKPVVVGDHFWSFFGRNVPDCTTYVNHTDGLALQYGNPANPANVVEQIFNIREHLFKMQGQTVENGGMPQAPCPGE